MDQRMPRGNALAGRTKTLVVALVPYLLFIAAFAIRLPTVERGLPYLDQNSWDEPFIMNRAIDCLRQSTWNPQWQWYPGGTIHAQTVVAGLTVVQLAAKGKMVYLPSIKTVTDTKYTWTVSVPEIYRNGRLFHVFLGSLLVVFVYLVGSRAFGRLAGLAAGLFMLVFSEAVIQSGFIKPDLPAALFGLGSFAGALAMLSPASALCGAAAAGLCSGLAAGFKYNAGSVIVAPLVAHFIWRHGRRFWSGPLALLVGGAAIGFFLTTPFALLDFKSFVEGLSGQITSYRSGNYTNSTQMANFLHFLGDFASRMQFTAVLVFAVGAFYALWRHTKAAVVLLVTALFILWSNAGLVTYFFRNVFGVTSIIALFFGLGIAVLWDSACSFSRYRFVRGLACIAAIAIWGVALVPSTMQSQLLCRDFATKKDSRAEMMDFLRKHLSAADAVAIDEHLHCFVPDDWTTPTLVVTNVFSKSADWFRTNNIRYIAVAAKYEYPNPRPQDRAAVDWMTHRYEKLPEAGRWGSTPIQAWSLIWAPKIVLHHIDDYAELPGVTKGMIPGVGLEAIGNAFLMDHRRGTGLELYSRGQFRGTVQLDTTSTQLRLCAGGYWRHPGFPRIRISATPADGKGATQVIADNFVVNGYDSYPVTSIPCKLGPGLWQITIDFLNGDDPLPVFEEKDARRLGIRLLEFLP
jgi:hypothetical protein